MPAAPILSQAFRPFFPLAALFASIAIVLWLAGLSGKLTLPAHPTLWHAHEMLFGFASAIIAGFVLTAVANWTGHRPAPPRTLAVLVLLWMTARLAALPGVGAQGIAMFADSLFLPGVALCMTRVLLKAGNRRNYMFIPFLWGLAGINLGFHLSLYLDRIELARLLLDFTAWLVGFLMVFMGGRVIPFFSARRCQYQPRQWAWLNWLSTLSALLAAILITALPQTVWAAGSAAVAGGAGLIRLLAWQSPRIWREPMLWILHLGYAWLGIAYLLAAAVHAGWPQSPSLPLHALLAGGLGCLGLGMMTRVALGHSGRLIQASPAMQIAFVLVVMAGLLRLGSYLQWTGGGLAGLTYSAIAWSLAFGICGLVFIPIALRKRHG